MATNQPFLRAIHFIRPAAGFNGSSLYHFHFLHAWQTIAGSYFPFVACWWNNWCLFEIVYGRLSVTASREVNAKKIDFVRIQNPIAWRHLVPSPIDSLQFGPANLFGCLLIVQKLVTALRHDSQWSFIAHANFHLNYLNSISEYKFGVFRYGE